MKPGDCELVRINLKKVVLFLMISALLPGVIACMEPDGEKSGQSAVLSSGDMMITRSEFEDHLELKMAAYPMDIRKTPDEFNSVVMALANDLTEELTLLRAAREKGIEISETEWQKAEKSLKEDYPEDEFEKMLLQNSVDYPFWKERFKQKLLIDKVVRQELMEKIEITSGEVVSYYNQLKTDKESREEVKEKEKEQNRITEEKLVDWIRRRKAQNRYEEWVSNLFEKFPVTVDREKLKSIMKSGPQK